MKAKAPGISEKTARQYLDLAAMIFVAIGPDGRVEYINKQGAEILGRPPAEILGRDWFDGFIPPAHRVKVRQAFEKIVSGRLRCLDRFENPVVTSSGEERLISWTNACQRGADGAVERTLSSGVDVTDLRRSDRTHRALTLYKGFMQSNDVAFFCDAGGVILDVNDAFTRIYGYTRKEAIGRTPSLLKSPHSTRELYERMWSSILDPDKGYWRGELINRAKDGREIPVLLTITVVRGEDGSIVGYVSNALDMTREKELHARVARTEALANLGEMAAVVAHEIRNPLGSIVMAARQLADGGLGAEDQELVIRALHDEGTRLNRTLTNFLSFARPRPPQLRESDLNRMLEDLCTTVRSNKELSRGLRIETKLDKRVKPFPMDPDQVNQVAWNLLLNSIQALEGKGAISIETGVRRGGVYFRVRDDGPGIPEPLQERVRKPFHTTKPRGTGLGLAIADRIAKAHGGALEIKSAPGRGTAITLHFPIAEKA